MMRHCRAPAVQHRGEADAGAEMLEIRRDREHRLCRGREQEIVDHGLVVVGDVADRRRQREDDMEIGHREQLGLARVPSRRELLRPGTRDSADCGSYCRRSLYGRSPHSVPHARRGRPCGSSMALITLSWSRLTWPRLASRHAAPWPRKILCTKMSVSRW